jgi:tubulin polyglutamylase TTLL1
MRAKLGKRPLLKLAWE